VISNLQQRVIDAPIDVVGRLVEGVLDPGGIWPAPAWPALRLDRGLEIGSRGGHGPIRYSVAGHDPGRWIRFDFDPSIGMVGYHELTVRAVPGGTELTHLLVGAPHGRMRIMWPLAVRWVHVAVLTDLLDNAERAATGRVRTPSHWSLGVRLLRRFLARVSPTGAPAAAGRAQDGAQDGERDGSSVTPGRR
jgi:hypothetical protein